MILDFLVDKPYILRYAVRISFDVDGFRVTSPMTGAAS